MGEAGALERPQQPEYFDSRELPSLRGQSRHRGIQCKRVFCSRAHLALACTEGGILGPQRADRSWMQPRHIPPDLTSQKHWMAIRGVCLPLQPRCRNNASSIQNPAYFGGGGCTRTVTAARVLRPTRAADSQRAVKTQEHFMQAVEGRSIHSPGQQSQFRGIEGVFAGSAPRSSMHRGRNTGTPAS